MKLLSLQNLLHGAARTLRRFPFALLCAGAGTVAALLLTESTGGKGFLHNLLVTAALGLPFFTVIPIVAEKRAWNRRKNLFSQFLGAPLLGAYFISLPTDVAAPPSFHLIRFFLLNIALHALVAFAPFTEKNDLNGFWQYNKSLFLRFLTAVLYSGVLYIGLVIALLAIDNLFGVDIKGERYLQLWIFIVGLFNSWFFLAGVPENLPALNTETLYPRGLKIFTQFVLIPLVLIYLVILYAYEIKILLNWNWPKGWVANLVLGFSVSGILALLLVHPIQERAENRWIKIFSKWYYVALIPLVGMLFMGIAIRIIEYGVTENRYFVFVLGLCLALVVLYFIFSRRKDIRIIPMALFAAAVLSSFGPWGAFTVSERSQVKRLASLLAKNEILVRGRVQKAPQAIPLPERKQISSMVYYLHRGHGFAAIQPWFQEDLQKLSASHVDSGMAVYNTGLPAEVVKLMGFDYVQEWENEESRVFYFNTSGEVVDIAGYDFLWHAKNFNRWSTTLTPIVLDQESWKASFDAEASMLIFVNLDHDEEKITFPLAAWAKNLTTNFVTGATIPARQMILEQASRKYKIKIYFSNLNCQKSDERVTIDSFEIYVLFRREMQ